MIVFLIHTPHGWGKGKSYTEAFKSYNKHNSELEKGEEYGLVIYKAKDIDEVYFVDFGMSIHRGKSDKQLYEAIEIV